MQVQNDPMIFTKQTSAGYLANHLARVLARRLAQRIAPLGLTPGYFPALLELWDKDGLTQKDLVERLDIEQATMANTLSRMERDGLIRRGRDVSDGRVQRIWLTEAARDLQAPATEAAAEVNAVTLAPLTPEEQAQLVALMGRVIAAAQSRRDAV